LDLYKREEEEVLISMKGFRRPKDRNQEMKELLGKKRIIKILERLRCLEDESKVRRQSLRKE